MSAARKFVRNPNLVLREQEGYLYAGLPYFGVEVRCRPAVGAMLDLFRKPAPLRVLRSASAGEDVTTFLVDHFLLLPADELRFLARGLLLQADRPAGRDTSWYDLRSSGQRGSIAFFHVPAGWTGESPLGDGSRAVRGILAPMLGKGSSILDFDMRQIANGGELAFHDLGDVAFDPGYETVEQLGLRIRKIVRAIADVGMIPLMVGGDHSASFFAIDEFLKTHASLGVLHFDAHPDLYIHRHASLNELNHSNVFHHLRRRPGLKQVLQLGLRDFFRPPAGAMPADDPRFRYISSMELRSLPMEQVFRGVSRELPYYLSFDVDVLDPAYAPETGTPLPGGLDYYRALSLIDYAGRNLKIVGTDFVELSGGASHNRAAEIVARYVLSLVFAMQKAGPLKTYVYAPGEKS